MASSLAQRAKRDPKLLRRALKNPGLRSKLPSSMLTPSLRSRRRMLTRQAAAKAKTQKQAATKKKAAKQPIVPGSSVTEGQLGKDTKAALDVKYGPLEAQQKQQTAEAQGYQRDIGGFYDQYLRQIAQQAANVRQIGAEANQAMAGLQGGVTGLATQDLRDIQAPANADAAARGMTAGNMAPLASNAAAIRQGILGSQGAQLATQGALASRYADTMANLVAPGQKLQGMAIAQDKVRQARQKQADTARERGAAGLTYQSERRTDEAKNVLAAQVAGVKAADTAADNAAARSTRRETKRHNQATERNTRAAARAKQQQAGQKINKYGYTESDWQKMPTSQRRKIIASTGGSGSGKSKSKLLAPGDMQAGVTNAAQLKSFVQKAKSGSSFVKGHGKQTPLGRHGAAVKITENVDVKNPVLLSAALDAVYGGGLSRTTAKRLRTAGYRPKEIAQALGTGLLGGRKSLGYSKGKGRPD